VVNFYINMIITRSRPRLDGTRQRGNTNVHTAIS